MTILQHGGPRLWPGHGQWLTDGVWMACGARRLRSRHAGRLSVSAGRVWITREGDLDDHVLDVGQGLAVAADQQVVVGPWLEGSPVRLAWRRDQPRPLGERAFDALAAAGRRLAAPALRAVAALRGAFAAGLLPLARSAAASDRRAQGAMALGESSACSGAAQ